MIAAGFTGGEPRAPPCARLQAFGEAYGGDRNQASPRHGAQRHHGFASRTPSCSPSLPSRCTDSPSSRRVRVDCLRQRLPEVPLSGGVPPRRANNQPMGFYSPSTLVKTRSGPACAFCGGPLTVSEWLCRIERIAPFGLLLRARAAQEAAEPSARARPGMVADIGEMARRLPGLRKDERASWLRGALIRCSTPHRRDALWESEGAARPVGPCCAVAYGTAQVMLDLTGQTQLRPPTGGLQERGGVRFPQRVAAMCCCSGLSAPPQPVAQLPCAARAGGEPSRRYRQTDAGRARAGWPRQPPCAARARTEAQREAIRFDPAQPLRHVTIHRPERARRAAARFTSARTIEPSLKLSSAAVTRRIVALSKAGVGNQREARRMRLGNPVRPSSDGCTMGLLETRDAVRSMPRRSLVSISAYALGTLEAERTAEPSASPPVKAAANHRHAQASFPGTAARRGCGQHRLE